MHCRNIEEKVTYKWEKQSYCSLLLYYPYVVNEVVVTNRDVSAPGKTSQNFEPLKYETHKVY